MSTEFFCFSSGWLPSETHGEEWDTAILPSFMSWPPTFCVFGQQWSKPDARQFYFYEDSLSKTSPFPKKWLYLKKRDINEKLKCKINSNYLQYLPEKRSNASYLAVPYFLKDSAVLTFLGQNMQLYEMVLPGNPCCNIYVLGQLVALYSVYK